MSDQRLTQEEFDAVYEFLNKHQDPLTEPFKRGMLKLLNREMRAQAAAAWVDGSAISDDYESAIHDEPNHPYYDEDGKLHI